MKRKLRILPVRETLFNWLEGHLGEPTKDVAGLREAKALAEALEELLTGEVDSLLLETSADEEGMARSDAETIVAGDLTIGLRERKVTLAGKRLTLTAKEFDILAFLAKNRGIVFTKEQIYRAVWERDYLLVDSNIMAFIRKLRKKIEPEPDNPVYILTVWGVGYKFTDEL